MYICVYITLFQSIKYDYSVFYYLFKQIFFIYLSINTELEEMGGQWRRLTANVAEVEVVNIDIIHVDGLSLYLSLSLYSINMPSNSHQTMNRDRLHGLIISRVHKGQGRLLNRYT